MTECGVRIDISIDSVYLWELCKSKTFNLFYKIEKIFNN